MLRILLLLAIEVRYNDCYEFYGHHNKTKDQELTIFDFWGKKADIDQLVQHNVEDGERNDAPLDKPKTSKLGIVHETEIVFVDVVFEHKEKGCKKGHIGH